MDPALRLHPGQQALTPAQEAEARRFAQEWTRAQLATSPVDEPEAERLLQQAYDAARLPAPRHIRWVDGPLQLLEGLAPESGEANVRDSMRDNVEASVSERVWRSIQNNVEASVSERVWVSVGRSVWASVWDSIGESHEGASASKSRRVSVEASVGGYLWASMLAEYRFYDEYLEPNVLSALAHFNALVSGYWVGQDLAVIVRRPRLLSLDAQGRLHSDTGTCLEYHQGVEPLLLGAPGTHQ